MQIDITKERPLHVWMGFHEEDFTRKELEATNKINGKKTAGASNQVIPQTSPQQVNASMTTNVSGVEDTKKQMQQTQHEMDKQQMDEWKTQKRKTTRVSKAMVNKIKSTNQ
ncbi:hypothetical protein H5410_027672 [Solanum commersonii]|uniref:Uncharacterized protein n=1 Tax=Solanum commersonii TaxID=4109 RepID=A0A9J5Z414_SOLCO|nr:hypothetical protein H5410_027672 [Solanum commersonii]